MPRYTPDAIPQEWRDLLLLIPGYDSIATAPDGAWFDSDAAKNAIDFIHECIHHVEGALAGKPFILQPWQQSFVANLIGWKIKDEFGRDVRRYREALLFVARKNGKSPLVAALALLILATDDEAGQQNYIAAGDREQAGMLFRQCKGMVASEPMFEENGFRVYGGASAAGQSRSIVRERDNSFLRVISADADTKHGGNTHLAIVDELHVQPNRDLIDVLQTSMASANRRQPLLILITTADFDRPSICNEKHDYACKVRDGVIDDPRYLPVIYEVGRDERWDDQANWVKANPNLGVSVSLAYLQAECKRAKEIPAYENTFRRLHLDQRTSTAEKCIPMDQWDACERPIRLEDFHGRDVHVAIDIGATSDFTAVVLDFPEQDGERVEIPADFERPDGPKIEIFRRSHKVFAFFWLPEHPVKRDQRMAAVIEGWRKEGLIRTTYGNVVDYDQVIKDMEAILAPFFVIDIAIDRGFQGSQMSTNLMNKWGENIVVQFAQSILNFNAPFRELLELVSLGRLHHDGNKVLRWMASNTMAEKRSGLIKPSKDKSPEKIDGITALTMCLGRASSGGSCYDSRGVITV